MVFQRFHGICRKLKYSPKEQILLFSDGVPLPRNPKKVESLMVGRTNRPLRPRSALTLVEELWEMGEQNHFGDHAIDDQSLVWIRFDEPEAQEVAKVS